MIKKKYEGIEQARYLLFLSLWKKIILAQPSYGMRYVPGVGMIDNEWDWCASGLEMLRYSIPHSFEYRQYLAPLVKYLRHKRRNP